MKQEALTSTRSVSQSSSHGKTRTVASLADAWIKIIVPKTSKTLSLVASFADAWIKISIADMLNTQTKVAFLVGAWIKIMIEPLSYFLLKSHPSGCVD